MSHALVARRAAEPQPLRERIHHPAHRGMPPIFDLDPVPRPASLIGPVLSLRYQSLQPHPAGSPKQIRPDLALFERGRQRAVRSAREQLFRYLLARSAELRREILKLRETIFHGEDSLGIVHVDARGVFERRQCRREFVHQSKRRMIGH